MFRRDALLLVGHGSINLPEAARPLLAHAEVIRGPAASARSRSACSWVSRDAASVFAHSDRAARPCRPVFSRRWIFHQDCHPRFALAARVRRRAWFDFAGRSDCMTASPTLIEARLMRHCEMFGIDPKSLSVLLVGHGSAQNPGRARALRRHAAALESGGRFGWVRVAFLEEAPLVAEALANARGHVVAVVGYLANEGAHATKDLPRLIAAGTGQRGTHWPPVHDLGSIGADDAMPRLLMDQVAAAR